MGYGMGSAYEHQLRQKANTFLDAIQRELRIDAQLDEESWRDYHVQLVIDDENKFNLYYSPKRDFFSITPLTLKDKVLRETIVALWEQLAADEAKPELLKMAHTAHQAFVDGSFDKSTKRVGYGAVILRQGVPLARMSGRVEKFVESHQIAGELSAAMHVLQWCNQQGIDSIDIFYDYKGIELWATGDFKPDSPMAQQYAAYVRQSAVQIYWHKVQSHTGIYWNEMADKLAKQGTQ